ncbi:MAG: hypothetical protein KGH65_04970 [Candidatus Micrarchaeota archaeon]|nr:hypothetical protein [Candidatus Micrarchaeota archaeon]
MAIYRVVNGASAGAAAPVKVTTGAAIKTLLQLLHPTQGMQVTAWGISFDGSAAATPIEVELCTTGTVAATVTAFVANDVTTYDGPADANVASAGGLTLSTSGSGYTASAEGSVVAPVRQGDLQLIAPTNQYLYQFPLGQEFYVPATNVLRVRVTAPSAVNAYCWVNFKIGGD